MTEGNSRRNLEAEALHLFRGTALIEGHAPVGAGLRNNERFDPFGLGDKRLGFQFGDLLFALPDRFVILEVESAGGVTNLAKYWPYATHTDRPILLFHGFAQTSPNDYLSHLRLWDFLWAKMQDDLWRQPEPKLFAYRFVFRHGDPSSFSDAVNGFKLALVERLPEVARDVFHFRSTDRPQSINPAEDTHGYQP